MNRFKNFFNKISNNSKIFSREEIKNMTTDEFRANEKAIDYQMENFGIPTNAELEQIKPQKGTATGAASNFEGMTTAGKIQSYLYEDALSKRYPNASKFTRNGMHNLFDAKMEKDTEVLPSINHLQDSQLKDVMYSLEDTNKNAEVVRYKSNSSTSKSFGNSPEIDKFIKDNYDDLKAGKVKSAPIEWNASNLDLFMNPEKFDRYSSVQHATLYNPKLDDNDNFTSTIVDYYDFTKRKPSWKNLPNNWGYDMQQGGFLKNYYNLIDINKKYKK